MANPFGGADQALSKNSGHTNQANLVRAFIPRSSSKWVEVISNTAITGVSSGSYDADGYFAGTDSTRRNVAYDLPANLNPSGTWTLIIGVKYNSAGGSAGGDTYVGIVDTVGGTAQFRVRLDAYARRALSYIFDSNSVQASTNSTWTTPASDAFASALSGTSNSQRMYSRIGTTNYPTTPLTSTDPLSGSAVCNKLQVTYCSLWATQYVLLYDAFLSEADINAIINDPGAVVQQTGVNLPHQLRRGAPRGIARGMQ